MNRGSLVVFLLLILLVGCGGANEDSDAAEQFITEKGYTIVKKEKEAYEYTLTKSQLTEMPYIQYWSVQSEAPDAYIGKQIRTSKFIVNHHPLDELSDQDKKQTVIYVMESGDDVIGGYSIPDYQELHMGWVYSIDGETLEEMTGMSYPGWLEEWNKAYK
ncbi:hypothetical protein [Saccharibacillus sacchari]|uniref:hypothetical protein n=1 Tax=Saccharibacillus sacchari TaxID=456493 RepID=UPI0004B0D044|nr:hypothetical protein [Saccharibacillus sacchari]